MKIKTNARVLQGIGVAIGMAIALGPAPSSARTCRAVPSLPPSAEMRKFQNLELGVSLSIPSNYRSMLRSSGHITFHDPESFGFIQCLVRTGEYGEVPPYTALEIHEGVSLRTDLIQIVRRKRPWVDYYSPEFTPIEVSGHPAIQYQYTNEIYQLPIQNISFLAMDRQTLITLSGPTQHPIMQNALSTLEIMPLLP